MLRGKEEIMDQSGSGSEQVEDKSGNEQEINNEQETTKKKRYHRHTARQIQEMEAYNHNLSRYIFLFLDLFCYLYYFSPHTTIHSFKLQLRSFVIHNIMT
jgi:hypothetical protein